MIRKDGRLQRMALMLGMVLAAVVGAFAVAPAAQAQERPFTTPRFAADLRGDVAVVGNTLQRCPTLPDTTLGQHVAPTQAESDNCELSRTTFPGIPPATGVPWCTVQPTAGGNGACPGAQNDGPGGTRRADVDGPGGMFDGSRATLTLPPGATVRRAFLYWSGTSNDYSGNPNIPLPPTVSSPPPNPALRFQATIDPPSGGAVNVNGDPALNASDDQGDRDFFLGTADVTQIVQNGGPGVYQVGNVQLGEGLNRSGGWALYVVYDDPSTNFKNVTLFDGFQFVAGQCTAPPPNPNRGCVTFNVSGFRTPPAGPVRTAVSINGQDGDYHLAPNRLNVGGTDLFNPLNQVFNVMNSTITNNGAHVSGRNPGDLQTNGYDLDVFENTGLLGNNQTSTQIIFGTDNQEPATLETLSFVTDLFEPRITNTKTAADVNGGLLLPGDQVEYTINTGNAAGAETDTATNFVLTDAIPANTTVVGGSILVDGSPGCSFASNTISCNFGLMTPAESHTITFRVTVNAGVPVGTVISNTCLTEYDSVTFPNANLSTPCPTANITVTGPPQDLTIDKRHSGNFTTGQPGTFEIEVSNVGAIASSGAIRVTDPMPTGLALQSATGSGWDCSASTAASMDCTTGAVAGPNGGTLPVITLTVGVDPFAPASIANKATVEGGGDSSPDNNSDTDTVTVVQSFDIEVQKQVTPTSAFPGDAVTFTILVLNNGPGASGQVTMQDFLPPGLTATQLTTNFGTCDLGTLSCTFPFFSPPPANTATVTLVATVNPGTDNTPQTNLVRVAPGAGDRNTGNHEATATVTILGRPDMTITKSHAPEPFVRGATGSFELTARNSGTASTSGAVTVTDAIPAGLSATSASGAGWDCNASTATNISCTRSDALGAGGNYPPITVNVAIAFGAVGPITNTGVVAGGGEVNTANNTDDDVVNLVDQFDVQVFKSVPNPADLELLPGEQGTFRVTVFNAGPSASGPITVDEQLPPGLLFVSQTINFGSCDPASHDCSIPFLNPGTGSTIDIVVQAPMIVLGSTETNVVTIDPGANDVNSGNHRAEATIRVLPVGRLDWSKDGTGNLVRGTNGTYTFGATNTGGAPTAGPQTINDPMQPGLTLVDAAGPGWDCSASTPTNMSCTRSDALAPDASYPPVTLTVAVALDAPPTITNTATVVCSPPTVCLPPPPFQRRTEDKFDVQVFKSVPNPADVELLPGEQGTFRVTVVNAGPSTSGSIQVDEALPPGLIFVSQSTTFGTCDATTHDCTIPFLNPGNGATIDIVVRAPMIVLGSTETNNVSITPAPTALGSDTNSGNHTAQATIRVLPVGRVDWTKEGIGRLVRGTNGTYTFRATNTGGAPTVGPSTITDLMQPGLTLVSATGPGWNCAASTPTNMSCTRSDALAPNASYPLITLTVAVSLTAPASVTNTAAVQCTPPTVCDPPPSLRRLFEDEIDLSIEKVVSPTPTVRALSNVTWTLTVRNAGPSNANSVSVDDALPTNMTFVSAVASDGGTCTGPDCSWATPIGPNQTRTITIVSQAEVVVPPASTLATNTATVMAANIAADTDRTNETDTASVTIVQPDLALDKENTSRLVRGANATWDLTVTNIGDSFAMGEITVVDTLPPAFTYVSAVGAGWTCSNVLQVITCERPGNIPAGQGVPVIEVTARVALNAPATLTNRACANQPAGQPDPNMVNNCDEPPQQQVFSEVDLQIVKTANPTSILATQQTTYTIVITNNGPSIAEDVVSTDLIPAGFFAPPELPDEGVSTTLGTCVPPRWTCTLGDLQPQQSETITIVAEAENAKPPAETTVTNTATVASSTTELDPTNNTDTADVEVRRTNDLLTVKTRITDPPIAGAPATFEVLVTNLGPSDAIDSTVSDPIPAPFEPGTITTSFVRGMGTCGVSLAGTTLNCDIPSILAGEDVLISVTGTLKSDTAGQDLFNTACAENVGDPETGNNCDDTERKEIEARSDIEVVKEAPAEVEADAQITYDVLIRNNGPSDAPGTVLADTIPAGTTFVDIDPDCPFNAADRTMTCDVGLLKAAEERTFKLTVDTALEQAGTTVTNTAVGSATPPDPNPNNNQDDAQTKIKEASDILVDKTAPLVVNAEQDLKYTITMSNKGPNPSPDTILTDQLPADMAFLSATTPQGTCSHSNGVVTCNLGTLEKDQTVVVEVLVRPGKSLQNLTVRNKATVKGPNADPNIENNEDIHEILVKPPLPDLRVTKTRKSGTARVGERVTYEIVAENIGNGPATNVVITDRLPAALTFISVEPSSGSCSGRQVVVCRVGNLPPGARATVTLVASVRTRGDHVNVAEATSDEPDRNPLDNRAELRTGASAMVDPVIRKRSTARSVKRGESVPYTITFRNPGPGTLRGVKICDKPPAGLTYVPGSASPRASLRNGRVCWTITSLAAGRSKTFRLRGRADMDARGSRLRNTVTASGPGMLTKKARASVPLSGAVLGQRAEGVTG